MFSPETYAERRNALRKTIKSGVVLLLGHTEAAVNYASNAYPFRQDSNFLYYFGLSAAGFVGVMDVDNDTDCLYANEWTMDDLVWMGPQPTVRELAERVGVHSCGLPLELEAMLSGAIKKGRRVHFLPPYRAENRLRIASLLGIEPGRVGDHASRELIRAVVGMREVKSPEEIEQLEAVAETGYRMHMAAMQLARPGVGELAIAAEMERIALLGGGRTSFHSIVSEHGETLHNHNWSGKLRAGRLLLVDAGAESAMGYASDHTRTIPVGGKFSDRQRDIYAIVLAANACGQALARPGVAYQGVHMDALKVIVEGLVGLGLMKGDPMEAVMSGAAALFMPHGLGHQMGLDVHDMEDLGEKYVGYDEMVERSKQFGLGSLRMGKQLQVGHVITVEPGIYFIPALIQKWQAERIHTQFIQYAKLEKYLDFGGIRLEDNIVITPSGNRLISVKYRPPISLSDVEAACSSR